MKGDAMKDDAMKDGLFLFEDGTVHSEPVRGKQRDWILRATRRTHDYRVSSGWVAERQRTLLASVERDPTSIHRCDAAEWMDAQLDEGCSCGHVAPRRNSPIQWGSCTILALCCLFGVAGYFSGDTAGLILCNIGYLTGVLACSRSFVYYVAGRVGSAHPIMACTVALQIATSALVILGVSAEHWGLTQAVILCAISVCLSVIQELWSRKSAMAFMTTLRRTLPETHGVLASEISPVLQARKAEFTAIFESQHSLAWKLDFAGRLFPTDGLFAGRYQNWMRIIWGGYGVALLATFLLRYVA